MKKRLWIGILTLLMCILCFVGVTACGSSIKGTYYLYKDGDYDKTSWIKLDGEEWTTSDNESGTYEVSDNQIVIYVDIFGFKEILTQGTVKDGVLTLKTLGVVTTYCKDGAKPSGSTETPSNPNNPSKPTVEKVTITYNANGGKFADGNETYSQTADKGALLTAPASPTRTNYSFAGWATSKNGSTMWKFDEDKATDGITLWAKWTEKSAVLLSVDGASIDGNEIFMLVDNKTDAVSLSNKVVCSEDSVWRLYYDRLGQTEIPTKMAAGLSGSLANGNNIFYIVVTSQDGVQTNLYELTVHRSYAVNVNYCDGATVLKSDSVYTGQEYKVNYTPKIDGYVFNYWKDTENKKADSSFTVWNPVRLNADKTANQYTATLNVNGGDTLSKTQYSVIYDKAYQFPVPTKTGHSFLGWYSGETNYTTQKGESVHVWNDAQNKTLTAKWEANTYTLTVKSNDEKMGTVEGGGDFVFDSNVTLTATTKNGYTFTGWYDNSDKKVSSSLIYQFNMGLNTTYTAKWIRCPVSVQSNNTSYGTVSNLPSTTVMGESYTVTATTKSGCTFVGWYNENTKLTGELSYNFTMPSENITYTAKWIKVTLESNNRYAGMVTSLIGTYMPGDSATATATTEAGYTFIGWYNEEIKLTSELSYNFTMPSEDITYTAKWIKVTLTSNNTSGGTVNYLSGTYKPGDNARATATTNKGYTFIGWYNGETKLTDELSYSFKMPSESVTYTAKWIKVTIISNNTSAGTVTPLTNTYKPGDNVTAIATTKTGYTFIGWYNGDTKLTSELSYNFEMPLENVTYTAKWIKVTITSNNTSAGTVTPLTRTYLQGDEVTVTATTRVGYAFIGWYDRETKLTGNLSYSFEMPSESVTYMAKWKVTDDMVNFIFTSTQATCSITGISDKTVTEIIVPDCVTSIAAGAFSGCSKVESLTIPFVGESRKTSTDTYQYPFGYIFGTSSYTGGVATKQCYRESSTSFDTSSTYYIPTALKKVTVTSGNILDNAFAYCHGLTSITILDGVTSIGRNAFDSCSGLTSITIPDSVTSIGGFAFVWCSGLTSIVIPDNVTSIGTYAFAYCRGLTSITIPDNAISIAQDAFYECSNLENKTFDNSIYIGDGNNPYLLLIKAKSSDITNCQINDKTKIICDYAFSECNRLTSIVIPNSVTSIGVGVFSGCNESISITVASGNTKYYIINNCLIESETKTLIWGCKDSIIPDNVTSIAACAFYGCSGLTSITIPDSVTSIGHRAFSRCYGLTSITIPDNVISIGNGAFAYSSLKSITIPDSVISIGEGAFSCCNGLEVVYWNAMNCVSAGSSSSDCIVFIFGGCDDIHTVIIGNNVKKIPADAFNALSGLTSIIIPDSVTSIGYYAFWACNRLTSVYYGGTAQDWKNISISSGNSSITSATKYYYYENEADVPTDGGNYWHYDTNGEIVIWFKEN